MRALFGLLLISVFLLTPLSQSEAQNCEHIRARMEAIARHASWADLSRLKALERQYYRCLSGGGNRSTGCRSGTYKYGRYCIPTGSVACPGSAGRRSCSQGTKCSSGGGCVPKDADDCGKGKYCTEGNQCWTTPNGIEGFSGGKIKCVTPERKDELNRLVSEKRKQQREEAAQKRRKVKKEREEKRQAAFRKRSDKIELKRKALSKQREKQIKDLRKIKIKKRDQAGEIFAKLRRDRLLEKLNQHSVRNKRRVEVLRTLPSRPKIINARDVSQAKVRNAGRISRLIPRNVIIAPQKETHSLRPTKSNSAEISPIQEFIGKSIPVNTLPNTEKEERVQIDQYSQKNGDRNKLYGVPIDQETAKLIRPYAVMASHAYGDKGSVKERDGYRRAGDWDAFLMKSGNSEETINKWRKSGFSATVFVRGRTGESDHEVVVAFRGTDKFFSDFVKTDIGGQWNLSNSQMEYAREFADHVKNQYPNAKIRVVGHSLGGALASEVGNHMGWDTYTFNAPRKLWKRSRPSAFAVVPREQINIWSKGDIVSDPDRIGSKGGVVLPGRTFYIELDEASRPSTTLLKRPIWRHLMDPTLGAISRAAK